jgi:hypothetical protein
MQMTGHKTRSVFERYNVTSGEDFKEAAKKLNEAAKNAAGTVTGTVAPSWCPPPMMPVQQILPYQCQGRELNPYAPCGAPDFKSGASASFATLAG